MYTSMATIFKITPLGFADIAALLGSGLLFMLAALFYQILVPKNPGVDDTGLEIL